MDPDPYHDTFEALLRLSPGALDSLDGFLNALPAWQDQAACAEPVEGASWFPERPERGSGLPDAKIQLAAARAVCEECPVRQECLEYALADPDLRGVWAGTTEEQRRQLRRERRQAA